MRRHCRSCRALLGMWERRCPCCRGSAMHWPHLVAFGALSLTAVFYLLVVVG
ncbi:MAG TPA: hypothetical protein VK421_11315 [Pyrinomonadaceae bacterium]|nr:hypothetical protein [Pyrinomonadaceae bacterium]